MMCERRVMQEAPFYGFSLERHVPDNHMLRRIDRFVIACESSSDVAASSFWNASRSLFSSLT